MGHLGDEKHQRSNKVICESTSGGELSTNFSFVRPRQELMNIGKLLLIWEAQRSSLCVNADALSFKYSQTVLIQFDFGYESSTTDYLVSWANDFRKVFIFNGNSGKSELQLSREFISLELQLSQCRKDVTECLCVFRFQIKKKILG